jgi:hypothetical protein
MVRVKKKGKKRERSAMMLAELSSFVIMCLEVMIRAAP